MPNFKKDSRIKELEGKLRRTEKQLAQTVERNNVMREQAETGFLNSPTYYKMVQELEYIRAMNTLNQIHYYDTIKRVRTADDTIRQVYADNQAFYAHHSDLDYFVGITEDYYGTQEYLKLKEEIRRLGGIVEGQKQTIADKDNEISRLQSVIATDRAKAELSTILYRAMRLEAETALSKEAATPTSDTMQQIIEQDIEQPKTLGKPGRPPKIDNSKVTDVLALKSKGYSIRKISDMVGISVGAVHRIVKMNG